MAINFITERTAGILAKAKFPTESYNVANDHKCFDKAQKTLWQQLADVFGIDLNSTGYTVRVVVKNGGTAIYAPYVGQVNDQACLVWGNVKKPLSEVNKELVEFSIGVSAGKDKRPFLKAFIPALDDTMSLTLMLAKGDAENATKEHKELAAADELRKEALLMKAFRQNKLHLYLSQSFEKAQKLAVIAGQTVEVTGYSLNRFGKYELYTSKGLVVGNTAIAKKLANNPVITVDQPAILEVGHSSGKTSSGYDIFPVILTTQADKELPVYDFGADMEENVVEEFTFE